MKSVAKDFNPLESRITQVRLPTPFRDSFSRFLEKRKIQPEKPVKTEIWNGIESAVTSFELPYCLSVTESIFDDWLAEPE